MFRQVRRGIFGWMRAGLIAGALFATLAIAEPAFGTGPGSMHHHRWRQVQLQLVPRRRRQVGRRDRRRRHHHGRLSAPGHELDRLPAEGRRRAQRRGLPQPLVRLDAGRQQPLGLGQRGRRAGRRQLRPVRRRDAELQQRARLAPDLQRGVGLTAGSVTGRTGARADRPEHPGRRHRPGRRPGDDGLRRPQPPDLPGRARGRRRRPRPGLQRRRRGRQGERAGRLPRRQRQPLDEVQVAARDRRPAGRAGARVVRRASARAARSRASSRRAPRAACR